MPPDAASGLPLNFTCESAYVVSLRDTVKSHGWVALAPWRWDAAAETLSRDDWIEGATTIAVRQSGARTLEIRASGTGAACPARVESLARRWLSLDWRPDGAITAARRVDKRVADAISQGQGRFLRGSTFYEDYLKTVCTIQINWAGTQRMVAALVEDIGEGFCPTPELVLRAGEKALRERARLGFRAKGVASSTERMLAMGLIDERGRAPESVLTYEALLDLHGIGPYAARHLRVLLQDFSRVPIDSEVTSYFRERHGVEPHEIDDIMSPWGRYQFLGYRLSRRIESDGVR